MSDIGKLLSGLLAYGEPVAPVPAAPPIPSQHYRSEMADQMWQQTRRAGGAAADRLAAKLFETYENSTRWTARAYGTGSPVDVG